MSIGFLACQNKADKDFTEIKNLEQKIAKQTVPKADSNSTKLLNLYDTYIETYGKTTDVADMMYKQAQLSHAIQEYDRAVDYYIGYYETYPTDKRAPEALMMAAFVCDNNVIDKVRAKDYYQKFMAQYPKHPYAKDAALSLKNIDKTPEELVKEFEAMAKDKN